MPIGLRLAIAILGTVSAAPVSLAGAAPAFNGNVCGLLTTKQATAISGYEATGVKGAGIHAAVGKDIVFISLSTLGTTPKSAAVVEPVATAVATRL